MLDPLADLERHAAERPDAVALATPERSFSFGELRAAVLAVAARLDAAGVASGGLVGVDLPAALEWIVDLALFRLGARAVSLRGVNRLESLALDVLVAESSRPPTAAGLIVEIDETWLDGAKLNRDAAGAAEYADDDIVRVILTSGTTGGIPKAAAYSAGALRHRSAEQHLHWTDGRPELTLIGLSTTGGFHAAVACLRLGVAYLAIDSIDDESMRFAESQNIEVLCGSPTQIAHAIHVMKRAGVTLPSLTEVRLAAATPPATLLRLIAETLGVPVRSVYGSTEGGGISQHWHEPNGDRFVVGPALPGVELQIIDERGRPVPAETEGRIRYRTPGLVSGYLVDGAIAPFADGWFVPGDLGRLSVQGELTLAGRESELMNIGGVKIDPALIDELALNFAGVEDAAAFTLERNAGIPELGLAVVATAACDLRALGGEVRAKLPVGHPSVYWRVSEIPRTRLGKPMRASLTEAFERSAN